MSFSVGHIRHQGSSLRLTIPPRMVRELGVREGEPVSMSVENGVLLVVKLSAEALAERMRTQYRGEPG